MSKINKSKSNPIQKYVFDRINRIDRMKKGLKLETRRLGGGQKAMQTIIDNFTEQLRLKWKHLEA